VKKINQKGQALVSRLTEKITLKLFRVGCETKNYELLKKLPLTAKEIETELNLTPMPTHKRIKALMDIGLITREKAGAKIKLTELGKLFLKHIDDLKEKVISAMAEMI